MIRVRPFPLVVCAFLGVSGPESSAQTPSTTYTTVARGAAPVTTSGTVFRGGSQLGIDAAGNLYVLSGASFYGNMVQRVTPAPVVSEVTASAGIYTIALTVDAAGNSYVGELLSGAINKITPAGDRTQFYTQFYPTAPAPGSPGLGALGALAFDASGTLHALSSSGVWKIVSGTAVRVAGGGTDFSSPAIDGPIGVATFDPMSAMAFDSAGNIYVAGLTVRKITPDGTTTTIAGARRTPGSADGVGTAARFNNATGIAVDSGGNLFIADSGNHTIRRMGTDGMVTTIAGIVGVTGKVDGPAATATFAGPYDLAFDSGGTLIILDGSIRKLAAGNVTTFLAAEPGSTSFPGSSSPDLITPRGVAIGPGAQRFVSDAALHTIRSFAGALAVETLVGGKTGVSGSADGVAAPTARFGIPRDLVFDPSGNAYVIDGSNVRRIAVDGTTTTFASGLSDPLAITRDASGTLYVAETCLIRKITSAGVMTTFATLSCSPKRDLVVDGSGAVFVIGDWAIFKITPDGVVTTFAGSSAGSVDGTGTAARFKDPGGLARAADGTIYVADSDTLRKVTPGAVVTTLAGLAGTMGVTDGDGSAAHFTLLRAITFGADGVLYASDADRLRSITTSGHVTTIAGATTSGNADGTGALARFSTPIAMTVDPAGLLFIVQSNRRVRTATTAGVVTTFLVGPGSTQVDGALFTPARFNAPAGIARAVDGTIYVADTGNHTIRKIAANVASTIAGSAGVSGLADGTGTVARFDSPEGIAVDGAGNLYVADTGNSAIRKIAPGGGVSTIPGSFVNPRGIAVGGNGIIYVADTGNHVIRAISTGGAVTTIAGSPGSSGSDDGLGGAARFASPVGVVVAPDGTLYVADSGNHTIRAISTSGVVTTIGGTAGIADFADATGAAARFKDPAGLALDASGAGLYIADSGNAALRLGVVGPASAPVITANPVNRSVDLHGTTRFSCDAVGTPSPSFSWEITGLTGPTSPSNYAGMDTAILTILDAPAALNGASFNCLAGNGAGFARSTKATLTVRVLTMSPSSLVFNVLTDAGGGVTRMTPAQAVTVGWDGTGAPPWTVTASQPWVQITNDSGTGAGTFTVAVTNPFAAGASSPQSAILTLTSTADPQFTKTLSISSFRLTTDTAPVGVIDTPANNATGLQGSIAVTGWALDSIEIDHVEIWRDRVAGETTPVFNGSGPGNGKIFIANPTFVPGARPDVQTAYGHVYPHAASAGWGYMLLTQGLWNQGNGTYTLYAFAFDKAGAFSTLGTKTITIDNANATKPFGTIDTPSYGGTVSGVIQNFGWGLTPGACSIANPNVQVSIDSGPLTPVVYGDVRTDVAGAFPGYTNAAAAGAHYTLDTTTLLNGMHTIGWLITDSCGRADGVGSRFFTVENPANIATTSSLAAAVTGPIAPRELALVRGTTSVDPPPATPDGTRVVRVEQSERMELQLPGSSPYVADSLPLGSSFEAAEGKFYWQPAAGFLGAYDLRFTAASRVENVRVVVGPPIRMVIDTPRAGNVLSASGFTLAGWAVDLASLDGAGIDTLHVWAYPVGGGAPVFVGAARAGGARPDVAKLYGQFFADAGFSVSGALAPGTYDLVVYAHSAASSSFAGAETVRVIVR